MSTSDTKTIQINKTEATPLLNGDWDAPCWNSAETISIDQHRPESSDHQPQIDARILHGENGLHLIYRVQDRYVRSVQTEFNSPVCTDSCVEFFVQPKPDKGYLTFEMNCGGTLLSYYVEDCRRTDTGFVKYQKLTNDDAKLIQTYHSMPDIVNPEIAEPTTWVNQLFIPFKVLEKYAGNIGQPSGQTWRANFYKCGDETSHPHWVSWNPVSELNFHMPECFGTLKFK